MIKKDDERVMMMMMMIQMISKKINYNYQKKYLLCSGLFVLV